MFRIASFRSKKNTKCISRSRIVLAPNHFISIRIPGDLISALKFPITACKKIQKNTHQKHETTNAASNREGQTPYPDSTQIYQNSPDLALPQRSKPNRNRNAIAAGLQRLHLPSELLRRSKTDRSPTYRRLGAEMVTGIAAIPVWSDRSGRESISRSVEVRRGGRRAGARNEPPSASERRRRRCRRVRTRMLSEAEGRGRAAPSSGRRRCHGIGSDSLTDSVELEEREECERSE